MWSLVDPITLILASLIIFLGAITQSLLGFGLAVVSTPLLYIVDPELVPVPVIILSFSIALLTLLRERGNLELGGLQYALAGRIPGSLLGVTLLLAPRAILGLIIAAIVGLAVWMSLKKLTVAVNRRSLFIAGLFSGIFGTVAGIGGPPMALLLTGRDAGKFRAALSAFFMASTCITLAILAVSGLITVRHLLLSALLLPAVFLGFLASGTLMGRVDKRRTRTLTLTLCSASALLLALKSLWALI
ncbi:sulfite exporter TauE/SafE family protein [Shewanella yunxiaonensis]|uniref:Probable membrane transporter protein n=1 Tax=Shewanella yunxiaonensis TaxID=2829809 RepID=A0ABX7YRU5_9GAMM|nr:MULTISPECIES: sulfite exporter TauE/SafE family protein [Shewanella]MDF0534167.1 sulfite exporter TauE/SafE family protein [Shewanella sp. A32]QUN05508.1 sulfite exporter TauE/SafE family protein [Shewanella yunxiaonensis]